MANKILNEFSVVFKGIGQFEGIFTLQVKDGSQPYQMLPKSVAYALQEPLREELGGL